MTTLLWNLYFIHLRPLANQSQPQPIFQSYPLKLMALAHIGRTSADTSRISGSIKLSGLRIPESQR